MPARKSAHAKTVAHTFRADRQPKPDRAARLLRPPRPPAHLSDAAKGEWRRLAPAVVAIGTLSGADFRAFELLSETLATAEAARKIVAEEGLTTRTADGGTKGHPAVKAMEIATNQAKALLSDFGLTPRGRQNVDPIPPALPKSIWDSFGGANDSQAANRGSRT